MRLVNNLHSLLQTLVRELKKVLLYGSSATHPDRVFKRNVSMTTQQFATGDIPYNLTEEEKAHQPDLLRYLFRKLTNSDLDDVTEENVYELTVPDGRKLYTLSTPEALSLVASPEAMSYLLSGNHFNSPEISAADMVFYYFGSHGQKYTGDDILTVEEGFSEIVNATVHTFLDASDSHSLYKNMKLESIRGRSGRYVLSFRLTVTVDDRTIDLQLGETVCANKIILALPKYSLSKVDWKPLRTRKYKDLLEGSFLVHASKVFFTYESPWWIDQAEYPTRTLLASGLGEVYDWGQSNVTGHWTLLVSYTKLTVTDREWVDNTDMDRDLLEGSIGGQVDLDTENPFVSAPEHALPRIAGSVYGENRVTAPLRDYLYNRLALAFGVPRSDIPDPVCSMARFWMRYPYGGGWVFTRPGYTYDELTNGYRRPARKQDVFVVGSDFSARDTTGWAEGALWTVEKVLENYF